MTENREYPERLHALAARLSADGFDAMLVTQPANLYYLCGFRTTLYTRFNGLLCTADGGSVLVTSYIDEKLAKEGVWGPVWADAIRIHGPLERADMFEDPLAALNPEMRSVSRLAVDDVSYALFRRLTEVWPGTEIETAGATIQRLQMIKTPDERAKLAEASRIALSCMEKARDVLEGDAVSEHELGAEIEFHARMMGADGFGYPTLISTGEKIMAPHSPPFRQRIPSDAPFVRVAFAPSFDGYTTSIIRTFARQSSETMTRFEACFLAALNDISGMLRPGVTVQDILATVDRSYRANDVRKYWGGDMGYGVGLSVHQPPRIGGTDRTVIEAGMVLALMPGLRRPGDATFHHSDIYAVTDAGCSCLSPGLQGLLRYG